MFVHFCGGGGGSVTELQWWLVVVIGEMMVLLEQAINKITSPPEWPYSDAIIH